MNRTLATLLTLAGLAGAYHLALGRLHANEIGELQRGVAECYARFDRAEVEAAQATALQESLLALEQWQRVLQPRITHDPLTEPTLAATRTSIESSGLAVERAEPLADDPSIGMPHQRLRFVASGEFAALFAAIGALENEAATARVTDLIVQATPGGTRVRADLTLVRAWSIER